MMQTILVNKIDRINKALSELEQVI